VPPEVLLGQEATERSDVYAIGTSLYFACTATLPFTPAVSNGPAPAPGLARPDPPSVRRGTPFPSGLDDLVLRCIATDPAHRFASESERAEALESLPI
jgi:serine/threonine protein kinase